MRVHGGWESRAKKGGSMTPRILRFACPLEQSCQPAQVTPREGRRDPAVGINDVERKEPYPILDPGIAAFELERSRLIQAERTEAHAPCPIRAPLMKESGERLLPFMAPRAVGLSENQHGEGMI